MKKMKFLTTMACCMAAFALTSCINNDGESEERYRQIGKTEKTVYMNAITGNYTGKLKFPKSLNSNELDSVDVAWTIAADSTVTVSHFPVKVLANYIGDATVKADVQNATPVAFKATAKLPNYTLEDYYQRGYYAFWLLPKESVQFMAGTKNAKINFAERLSYGQRVMSPEMVYYNKNAAGYILIRNVVIDSETYNVELPMILTGKKST